MKRTYIGLGIRKGSFDLSCLDSVMIDERETKTLIGQLFDTKIDLYKALDIMKSSLKTLGVKENDIIGIYNFLA